MKADGFRGLKLTKEITPKRKSFLLNSKADRKNAYPGSYSLSEIALKIFMLVDILRVDNSKI